jgi:CheY-like chemotaxis protein
MAGRLILIVENEPLVALQMTLAFEDEGAWVTRACNLKDALDQVENPELSAAIRLDEGGRLSAVRIDAAARLGFGTRQVEIPGRAVTIVRGVAVLALPKDAIESLPSIDGQQRTKINSGIFTPSDV